MSVTGLKILQIAVAGSRLGVKFNERYRPKSFANRVGWVAFGGKIG